MKKKKKGFSLIELLLVLVFIGFFMAMTLNFSVRNKDRWALRDITREITSVYYQAKQRASRENASVRLDINANGYTYYWIKDGDWEVVKNESFPKKITAITTADFKISSMGFLLDPAIINNTILSTQTIVLTAPRGAYVDRMTITIYPYGGLNVKKEFSVPL